MSWTFSLLGHNKPCIEIPSLSSRLFSVLWESFQHTVYRYLPASLPAHDWPSCSRPVNPHSINYRLSCCDDSCKPTFFCPWRDSLSLHTSYTDNKKVLFNLIVLHLDPARFCHRTFVMRFLRTGLCFWMKLNPFRRLSCIFVIPITGVKETSLIDSFVLCSDCLLKFQHS